MSLDDLVDDSKEEQKQKEVDDASGELGIEDLDDLEQFSDSVQLLRELLVIHDSKLEDVELLKKRIREMETQIDEIETKIQVVADKVKDAD